MKNPRMKASMHLDPQSGKGIFDVRSRLELQNSG
jgi:hypothetical protein